MSENSVEDRRADRRKAEHERRLKRLKRIWIGVSILIVLLVVGFGALLPNYIEDAGRRGTFGDQFGSLNALFSGLAFAGVIYTMLMQSLELGMQREEIEQNRGELAKTAEAQGFLATIQQDEYTRRVIRRLSDAIHDIIQLERTDLGDLRGRPNDRDQHGNTALVTSLATFARRHDAPVSAALGYGNVQPEQLRRLGVAADATLSQNEWSEIRAWQGTVGAGIRPWLEGLREELQAVAKAEVERSRRH